MADPASSASTDLEAARVTRQRRIVLGLFATFLGLFVLVIPPDLTKVLTSDLGFLASSLVLVFLGGILLGMGYRGRPRRR